MRSTDSIIRSSRDAPDFENPTNHLLKLVIEVLLDIRALLKKGASLEQAKTKT